MEMDMNRSNDEKACKQRCKIQLQCTKFSKKGSNVSNILEIP